MQDIHAIGGGAGRLFTAGGGGGGGGGDRRMRPHNHQNHQPLKCPRCDSLNTKFCYYNNYNLSQPRHFCKSCRRYWTKGGVLRNVPIGGGCRKSKRSKPKPSASGSGSVSGSGSTTADVVQREQKSNSHSSSESSSLTATTTTATAKTTAGAISEEVSATNSNLLNFADSSRFFISQNATTNPGFDHQPLIDDHASNGQIFSDIGSFTDMMTSSSEPALLGFNAVDMSAYRLQQNEQHAPVVQNQSSNEQWQNEQQQQQKMVGTTTSDELKMHEINATGYLDQIDLTALQQSRGSNGGLAALDWQNPRAGGNCGSGEQGMFDFTGAVDQAYWCQTQWHDHDQSLNFLP